MDTKTVAAVMSTMLSLGMGTVKLMAVHQFSMSCLVQHKGNQLSSLKMKKASFWW